MCLHTLVTEKRSGWRLSMARSVHLTIDGCCPRATRAVIGIAKEAAASRTQFIERCYAEQQTHCTELQYILLFCMFSHEMVKFIDVPTDMTLMSPLLLDRMGILR